MKPRVAIHPWPGLRSCGAAALGSHVCRAGRAGVVYTRLRGVEMRSDWGKKLGVARGWLMGAAVVVIALVYLLRR
jgi:hypothetical protein